MTEPSVPSFPLWELVQTAHLAERRFTEVFAEAGLTPAQFGVLQCVADGDDLSQADLARTLQVRPQSMGRLVSDMVGLGLLRPAGARGRGRRFAVALTEEGLRRLGRAYPAALGINTPEAVGLSPDEVAALVQTLRRLRGRLQSGTDRG